MTAPIAPRDSSFHMKWKRSWPGVPNRYSTISGVSVIRPKSIATVVVVLPVVFDRSSTPVDADVIVASDRNGSISLIELTNVDLPAPKPPATTILTGILVIAGESADRSEIADTVEHPFQEACVVLLPVCLRLQGAVGDQVGDQHLGDPDRHVQAGGDLDQCHRRAHHVDQVDRLPPVT